MKKMVMFLALMLFGVTICYAAEMEVQYFTDDSVNTVVFEIDTTYNNIAFKIYNYDTGDYIGRIYLSPGHMSYTYAKGLNIRLVEDTTISSYEKLEDIILFDESKVLKLERVVRDMKVTIKTIYRGYGKYIESVDADTDVTIYDEDFNEVSTCKSEGDCEIILPLGVYYIKDNKYGFTTKEGVTYDKMVHISRYFIDGIFSEEELDLENTTRHGKIYYFNDPVYPEEMVINGDVCDLSDNSKYFYIFGDGIFYKYSKKDEVIKNDENGVKDKEETLENTNNNTNNNDNNDSNNNLDENHEEEIINNDVIDKENEELFKDIPSTDVNINVRCNNIIYFKKKYLFEI